MRRFLLALLTIPALGWAVTEDELLPVDQAFAIESATLDERTIRIAWTIAEGYYLYRHRISFKSLTEGIELGEPDMPAGKAYEDEFFGQVETYRHRLEVDIPVVRSQPGLLGLKVEARSQGCADVGVCYMPHRQFQTVRLAPAGSPLAALNQLPAASAPSPVLSGGSLDLGTSPPGLGLDDQPLPEDQAFLFEAIALDSDELLVRWTVADGYYMYRDQIAFEVDESAPVRLGEPVLPPGEDQVDDHFGNVKVIRGLVEVPLPVARLMPDADTFTLTGHYRGCKDESICYPPIVRSLEVELPSHGGTLGDLGWAMTSGAVAVIEEPPIPGASPATATKPRLATAQQTTELISEHDRLAQALDEDSLWTLLSFFGFGLLLAFTPCVFPMVPILSGIIAGQGEGLTTRRAFVLSLVYVMAMAVTYTVAGVIAGLFGRNLQAAFQNAWILGGFSLVFVLLALSMFGFYELQLPSSWQTRLNQVSNRQRGGSLTGVAVMGFLSALIVGPCVAPPLAAALIYIGQSGDAWLGGSALFALSMGMGAPLIVVGTGAGRYLPRAGAWMDAVKAVFGVALLGLALWMLERIADPTLILFGWGILFSASGIYMGALERLPEAASGWRKLWKSLGVMLLILGIFEFIGAASGARDWMQPLKGLTAPATSTAQGGEVVTFRKIKSLEDLNRILAETQRPVMLDFYADWCVDCKRMDRYTFPEAPVQAALREGVAVKADVTANDEVDQALVRHFKLIGPPAILFFAPGGQELGAYRVIGYRKPEEFAEHVKAAFEAAGSLE